MKKIVSIGALNVDTILYVEKFCEDDEEQAIKEEHIFSGGQAGNIASGLGKLGKQAFFFGNIGDDEHTKMLLKDFDKCNVDYSFAKKTNNPNNSTYCLVDKEGRRRLYCYNYTDFSAQDFPEEFYNNTGFIIFSSIIKEDAIQIYTEIAKKAKENGIKIALDPGNIFARLGFDKLKPLLEFCDYIFPSLNEVNMIVGGIENISKLNDIVPNVIVTCGGDGVIFFKNKVEIKLPNPKQVRKIDTTGAGDCFTASFVSAIIDGKDDKEAINFAMYSALLSITKKGARSTPEPSEIYDFIDKKE